MKSVAVILRTMALMLLPASCVTGVPPTPEKLAGANYGPQPTRDEMLEAIRRCAEGKGLDLTSAHWELDRGPAKGWALPRRSYRPRFGWLFSGQVLDAKGRFGQEPGGVHYLILWRSNTSSCLTTATPGLEDLLPADSFGFTP